MKIVYDTSVLIASIITHGSCFEVFEYCLRNHEIITSNYIIEKFKEKLINKFNYTKREVEEVKLLVFERIKNIGNIENIIINGLKDKDDYKIIGTAIKGNCKCIITGDKELVSLKKYKGIDIIFPKDFWEFEVDILKEK